MAKFYISSTYKDLLDERAAAAQAVRRLGHQAIAMEDYVAGEERPVDKCLADVCACDAYIGIVAWRYGTPPEAYDKSVTHLEYDEAGKIGIPRLIFLLDEAAPWPRTKMDDDATRIKQFRAHLSAQHLVGFFSNPDQLGALVLAAISQKFETARTAKIKPDPPSLLPYLSDRSEQETALRTALNGFMQKKSRRPFLCVIHGDEYECHDRYLERLLQLSLPKIFNLDMARHAIKDFPLPWPTGGVADFSETLHANLAEALAGASATSKAALNSVLAHYSAPVLLHAHLLTDDWQHRGAEAAQAFIKFWQEWPELAPGQRLVVALFFTYQSAGKTKFWQPRKRAKLNQAIREFLAKLDFSAFERLHGLVLPELNAITRTEVEDWVRQHTREFCDPGELLPKIRELYNRDDLRTPDGGIPMERLAKDLKKLLNENRC